MSPYSPAPWFYPDFAPFNVPTEDERSVGFIVADEQMRASRLDSRPPHPLA